MLLQPVACRSPAASYGTSLRRLPGKPQEAVRLHQLRHPAVVGFVGVALSGSRGILLLEMCEGRDLYRQAPSHSSCAGVEVRGDGEALCRRGAGLPNPSQPSSPA